MQKLCSFARACTNDIVLDTAIFCGTAGAYHEELEMIDIPCGMHDENTHRQSFSKPLVQIVGDEEKDSVNHDEDYGGRLCCLYAPR